MTCGIYLLRFENTAKVYIGKSKDIENRLKSHLYKMRAGIAPTRLLEAYNLFGAPTIETVLECSEEELTRNEIDAISIFNSVENGFNTNSEDSGKGNHNTGETHHNCTVSNSKILEVFNLLIKVPVMEFKDISAITGVSYSIIADISKCENHKWLAEVYPEQYLTLVRLKNNRKSAYAKGIDMPKLISPEGQVYDISNIRAFSREHGLLQTCLGKVLKGTAKSHKGWKLAKGELS